MKINISGNSFAPGASVIGTMSVDGKAVAPTFCKNCGGKTFPKLGPNCPYCGRPVDFGRND